MNLVLDSRRVLNVIYELLNDDSYTLVINVYMDVMAKELNMSIKHLNLCIHYLIDSGYLKGDYVFNTNPNSSKTVFLTALAVDKIENTSI